MPRNAPGLGDTFSYSEGRAAGLTPDELRHPGWSRSFHAVRAFREPETVVELAEQYATKLRPEYHFSHTTAAILHRTWLPLALQQRMEVHVACPPGLRQPRGKGVRGHLLVARGGPLFEIHGLPTARPEETWCQLATILGLEDLIIAGESLMAKGRDGRLPIRTLTRAVEAGDRPRQQLLNRALPELRSGVRSAKETELRRLIVASGLPEPAINQDIFDDDGNWIAESDLVYERHKIAIEYEGELHFLDKRIQIKDVHRYELLQALGWRIIRVTKDDLLLDRAGIIARLRSAIESRA